jgi:hypothetical protein
VFERLERQFHVDLRMFRGRTNSASDARHRDPLIQQVSAG